MKPIIIGALAGVLTACQAQPSVAPAALPAGVAIAEPAQDVPAEYARFSGIWRGYWGKDVAGTLAVERIDAKGKASGIFSVGPNASKLFGKGSHPFVARVMGERLTLAPFANGALVSYAPAADGTLAARHDLGGIVTTGTFRKTAAQQRVAIAEPGSADAGFAAPPITGSAAVSTPGILDAGTPQAGDAPRPERTAASAPASSDAGGVTAAPGSVSRRRLPLPVPRPAGS